MGAYEYIQGEPTIQTLGDIVRDAQRITIRVLPSRTILAGVFAPWPSDIWTPQAIDGSLSEMSDLVAGWLATKGVTAVGQTQETNDLNELVERYLVAIKSSSEKSSAVLNLAESEMNPQTFPALIAANVAELDGQESGSTAVAGALAPLAFPTATSGE